MTNKVFHAFFAGQDTDGEPCFEPGECTGSLYLDNEGTEDPQECLVGGYEQKWIFMVFFIFCSARACRRCVGRGRETAPTSRTTEKTAPATSMPTAKSSARFEYILT